MMNWFQRCMAFCFGCQYVILVHFDGEKQVHRAYRTMHVWSTTTSSKAGCTLFSDGDARGLSHIGDWQPLTKTIQSYYYKEK